jgi:membrane protein implicated in regulation of membrane protease activity
MEAVPGARQTARIPAPVRRMRYIRTKTGFYRYDLADAGWLMYLLVMPCFFFLLGVVTAEIFFVYWTGRVFALPLILLGAGFWAPLIVGAIGGVVSLDWYVRNLREYKREQKEVNLRLQRRLQELLAAQQPWQKARERAAFRPRYRTTADVVAGKEFSEAIGAIPTIQTPRWALLKSVEEKGYLQVEDCWQKPRLRVHVK